MNKAEQLVKLLIEKKYTVSFAESCTGGKMAARIVDVPDASKVLNASIVTYANEAKMKYANVSKDTLKQYGAVSENTAREMAEGVAKANNADVAAGISGIAGPTGGTEDKPVGMVCFGFYIDGKVFSDTKHFGNIGRNNVRDESVEYVLDVLIKELSQRDYKNDYKNNYKSNNKKSVYRTNMRELLITVFAKCQKCVKIVKYTLYIN